MPVMEGNAEEAASARYKWIVSATNKQKRAVAIEKSNYTLLKQKKEAHDRGEISAAELQQATEDYTQTKANAREATKILGLTCSLMEKFDELTALTHDEE